MSHKRSLSHWSDYDFSEFTWERVFQEAGIQVKDPNAQMVLTYDWKSMNLKQMFEGEEWAERAIRRFCPTDAFRSKIFNTVLSLRKQAGSKRSKFEQDLVSPSDYAKSPKADSRIHDGRSSTGLHVGLQLEAFGTFMDITNNRCPTPEMGKYYQLAHSLMQVMSDIYRDESCRVSAFQNALLRHNAWRLETLYRGRARSDCSLVHVVAGKKIVLLNFELKNELCSSDTCPNKQNIGYFLNFKAGETGRSPMLLVSLAGPHYFQVFGGVWNGGEICVDPLSDLVSLLSIPRNPRHGVEQFARVLAAIDSTVEKLKEYYERQEEEEDTWGVKGPYPLVGIHDCKTFGHNWLFEARRAEDGVPVVVKFVCSHYGYDAHKFLATKNLAPKLYFKQALPGRWFAIVMEKVEGTLVAYTDLTPSQKRSLKDALQLLHANNYVHGDLCPQNILAQEGKVCIVDFDWAGECGRARYPPELILREGKWHGDVECGGVIRKEHDQFQVDKLAN